MHHGGVIGEPFLNPSICSVLAKAVKLFMSKPRQIAIKAAFLGSATCHLAYVLLMVPFVFRRSCPSKRLNEVLDSSYPISFLQPPCISVWIWALHIAKAKSWSRWPSISAIIYCIRYTIDLLLTFLPRIHEFSGGALMFNSVLSRWFRKPIL